MPKKVTANGKTFTFDDNTSTEDIASAIDEYFAGETEVKKKENSQSSPSPAPAAQPAQPTPSASNGTPQPKSATFQSIIGDYFPEEYQTPEFIAEAENAIKTKRPDKALQRINDIKREVDIKEGNYAKRNMNEVLSDNRLIAANPALDYNAQVFKSENQALNDITKAKRDAGELKAGEEFMPTTEQAAEISKNAHYSALETEAGQRRNAIFQTSKIIKDDVEQNLDKFAQALEKSPVNQDVAKYLIGKQSQAESVILDPHTNPYFLGEYSKIKKQQIEANLERDLPELQYTTRQVKNGDGWDTVNEPTPESVKARDEVMKHYAKQLDEFDKTYSPLAKVKSATTAIMQGVSSGKVPSSQEIGRMTMRALGDPTFAKAEAIEKEGVPLTPKMRFEADLIGQSALKDAIVLYTPLAQQGDEVSADIVKTASYLISGGREQLYKRNPEFVKEQAAELISDEIAKNPEKYFNQIAQKTTIGGAQALKAFGMYDVDDEMISKAAKNIGLKYDQYAGITDDDIKTGNILGAFASGIALDPLADLSAGMDILGNKIKGYSWDASAELAMRRKEKESFFKQFYQVPAVDELMEKPTIIDNDPTSETYLQDVRNPNSGKFNFTVGSLTNTIAYGYGQVLGLGKGGILTGKGLQKLGALGTEAKFLSKADEALELGYKAGTTAERAKYSDLAAKYAAKAEGSTEFADKVGMFTYGYVTGVERNYEAGLQKYEGQKDQHLKAAAYSAMYSFIENIVEQAGFSEAKFVRGLDKSSLSKMDELVSMMASGKPLDKKSFIAASSKVAKGLIEGTKDVGGEVGEEVATNIGGILWESITGANKDPNYNFLDEQYKTAVQTGLQMVLTQVAKGYRSHTQKSPLTKNLMNDIANNPVLMLNSIAEERKKGKIDQETANKRIQVVNTLKDLGRQTPQADPVTGRPLSKQDRIDYLNESYRETVAQAEYDKTTDQVQKDRLQMIIDDARKNKLELMESGVTSIENQISNEMDFSEAEKNKPSVPAQPSANPAMAELDNYKPGRKIVTDFDGTIVDKNGEFTAFGKRLKEGIDNGTIDPQDVRVITARGTSTGIADKLGINSLDVTAIGNMVGTKNEGVAEMKKRIYSEIEGDKSPLIDNDQANVDATGGILYNEENISNEKATETKNTGSAAVPSGNEATPQGNPAETNITYSEDEIKLAQEAGLDITPIAEPVSEKPTQVEVKSMQDNLAVARQKAREAEDNRIKLEQTEDRAKQLREKMSSGDQLTPAEEKEAGSLEEFYANYDAEMAKAQEIENLANKRKAELEAKAKALREKTNIPAKPQPAAEDKQTEDKEDEPTSVTTQYGWTFVRMADGTYTDGEGGDFASWAELKKHGEEEGLKLKQSTKEEEKTKRSEDSILEIRDRITNDIVKKITGEDNLSPEDQALADELGLNKPNGKKPKPAVDKPVQPKGESEGEGEKGTRGPVPKSTEQNSGVGAEKPTPVQLEKPELKDVEDREKDIKAENDKLTKRKRELSNDRDDVVTGEGRYKNFGKKERDARIEEIRSEINDIDSRQEALAKELKVIKAKEIGSVELFDHPNTNHGSTNTILYDIKNGKLLERENVARGKTKDISIEDAAKKKFSRTLRGLTVREINEAYTDDVRSKYESELNDEINKYKSKEIGNDANINKDKNEKGNKKTEGEKEGLLKPTEGAGGNPSPDAPRPLTDLIGKKIKVDHSNFVVKGIGGPFSSIGNDSYGNHKEVPEYYQLYGPKESFTNVFINDKNEIETLYTNIEGPDILSIEDTEPITTQEPKSQKPKKTVDPEEQRLLDAFKEKFKNKFGGNSGISASPEDEARKDIEMLAAGADLMKYYIKKGIKSFAEIADNIIEMMGEVSDNLITTLKKIYMGESVETDGLDDVKTVRSYTYKNQQKQDTGNPRLDFISEITDAIRSGKKLNIVSIRKIANDNGLKNTKDTELQEYVELAIINNAKEIAQLDIPAKEKYDMILDLYKLQPTISMRSSERISKQQYSTPLPMSFLAGEYVNHISPKRVLEPSAGNGMMVFNVKSGNVIANEIDSVRLSNLEGQGFHMVTNQDGTKPFNIAPVDAVVTNPPFGGSPMKVYGDVYKISGLDEQMVINALDAMKDDGRASIIIGGHTKYNSNGSLAGEKAFFNYLYNYYNVADVINVEGDLYAKQGTSFPVRMILINGRRTNTDQRLFAPLKENANSDVVKTFEDLYERVNQTKNENLPQQVTPTIVGGANQQQTTADQRISTQGGNTKTDNSGKEGQGKPNSPSNRPSSTSSGIERPGTTGTNNGDRSNSVPDRQNEERPSSGIEQGADIRLQREDPLLISDRPDKPNRIVDTQSEKVKYMPQSKSSEIGSVIPVNMAQALQGVLSQFGDIDSYVQNKLGYKTKEELFNALSAEQIDSVALAIYQIENGKALIIGDMTGVGKGRQAAAIIRYGVLSGLKPIFMTEKPHLFSDIYRDMKAIGSPEMVPFIVNNKGTNSDPTITDEDGTIVYKPLSATLKKPMFERGAIPNGYDYVVTTYSQFSSSMDKPNVKNSFLSQIAAGNIIVLDESHNAGGEGNTGAFMQEVLVNTKGVVFLSGTFAKRPSNMPIYSIKTAMSDANMSNDELIEAIIKGGVPLQEIMSKNLVEVGQMIRRERDFTGVSIDWETMTESKEAHTKVFDEIIGIFNELIHFQRDHINPIIENLNDQIKAEHGDVSNKKGTSDLGISNPPFASKTFNLVRQLLLSLKAEDVAREVIAELKAGRKPVVGIANTMGSFLKDLGISEGDILSNIDYSLTLKKGLDGLFRYTEKTFGGDGISRQLSVNDLSEEGRTAYNDLYERIKVASSGITISPIDVIQKRVREAGYTIAELTGRDYELMLNDDGSATVSKRRNRDKKKLARDFNNGDLDVLIINQSGSTGISLHASETFKDKRQRVMVSAQTQLDVNTEIQLRGRIDRTGQKIRGAYRYIISPIPAEQRLIMMFKAKLKSLDANTTSSQKSKTNEIEVVDFLNKYGDEIVMEYLKENRDINDKLLDPFKFNDKSDEDIEELKKEEGGSTKVSGRVALLNVKEQEAFYKEVTERYLTLINYLNDNNANDLEIKTLPLNAETKEKIVVVKGIDNGNPFSEDSIRETVEIDVLKSPMKSDEIKEEIEKLTDGESNQDYRAKNLDKIEEYTISQIESEKQQILDDYAKKEKKVADLAIKKAVKEEGNPSEYVKQALEDLKNARDAKIEQNTAKRKVVSNGIKNIFKSMNVGRPYLVPNSIDISSNTTYTPGIFLGFKMKSKMNPSNITAIFATLDGRRKVEIPLSKMNFLNAIIAQSNHLSDDVTLDNWDTKTPKGTRRKAFIITGNILQAYAVNEGGQLVTFTTKDGQLRQGILLPESYKDKEQKMRVQIIAGLNMLRDGKVLLDINNEISVEKRYDDYKLRVPLSKQRGGKYFLDDKLRDLVIGRDFVQQSGKMEATITENRIGDVLQYLSTKHNTSIEVEAVKENTDKPKLMASSNPVEVSRPTRTITKKSFDKLVKLLQKAFPKTKVFTDEKTVIAKLKEYGYDVAQFLSAWHGSPYSFDKFSMDRIGTGEGSQFFGYGLYFTDLKGIAENYAKSLGRMSVNDTNGYGKILIEDAENTVKSYGAKDIAVEGEQKAINEMDANMKMHPEKFDNDYNRKNLEYKKKILDAIKNLEFKSSINLYKVSLHKGKTPEQYNWLEWDKPVTPKQRNQILSQLDKERGERKKLSDYVMDRMEKLYTKNLTEYLNGEDLVFYEKYKKDFLSYSTFDVRDILNDNNTEITGESLYHKIFAGNPKESSLLLLRAGIDGVKYPAESIARGSNSDTARGFNYVVFDENAIEIEEKIQFLKTPNGVIYGAKFPDGSVYVNPEFLSAETAIHEFSHIWEAVMPEAWARGVEMFRNSSGFKAALAEIEGNPQYKDLTKAQKESEALNTLIGRKGEGYYKKGVLLSRFQNWLTNFFKQLAAKIKLRAGLPALRNITPDDRLDQFVANVLNDLTGGKEIVQENQAQGVDDVMLQATSQAENIKLEYNDKGQHLAPNGKPSNLTEQQAKIVRTQSFKNWFGDWENDPKNASKVVDINGEPARSFRGDSSKRSIFDDNATFFSENDYVAGSYSNVDAIPEYEVFLNIRNPLNLRAENSKKYAGNDPYTVSIFEKAINELPNDYIFGKDSFAEMNKMEILNAVIKTYNDDGIDVKYVDFNNQSAAWDAIINYAKKNGFDGVLTNDESVDRLIQHKPSQIVFSPNQIKLADGTNTTFNPESNDIRYMTLPDGRKVSVRDMGVDVVNGFYSPLEKVISETKFDKLPAKQWLDKFAKGEEAKWTGLQDWLSEQQGSVSKSDIQKYLKENRVQIVEVVKGEGGNWEGDDLIDDNGETVANLIENEDGTWSFQSNFSDGSDYFESRERAKLAAEQATVEDIYRDNSTKFSQWQLEGENSNYKEILVTLPSKNTAKKEWLEKRVKELQEEDLLNYEDPADFEPDMEMYMDIAKEQYEEEKTQSYSDAPKEDGFESSHFDEDNIVVHLRMNTRTDAEGNKVLFLEEIQSDWGQTGKNKGFDSKSEQRKELERRGVTFNQNGTVSLKSQDEFYEKGETWDLIKKYNDTYTNRSIVPQAPFVMDTNAWTKLGLKVALKEAVKQGLSKIAWTTGEQQNDRYDLSKQVDDVYTSSYGEEWVGGKFEKRKDVEITVKGGEVKKFVVDDTGKILSGDFVGERLDNVIGKEMAEKILSAENNTNFGSQDLKVGGKGMKGFYGSPTEGSLGIVGNVAKSLFKQEPTSVLINTGDGNKPWYAIYNKLSGNSLGGGYTLKEAKDYIRGKEDVYEFRKVKGKGLDETTQHSIDITPELKAQVEEGLPLFMAGPLSSLDQAKDRLKKAYGKLGSSGMAFDPVQDQKDFIEFVKALVGYAGQYAKSEVIDKAKDFIAQKMGLKPGVKLAKSIGDAVADYASELYDRFNLLSPAQIDAAKNYIESGRDKTAVFNLLDKMASLGQIDQEEADQMKDLYNTIEGVKEEEYISEEEPPENIIPEAPMPDGDFLTSYQMGRSGIDKANVSLTGSKGYMYTIDGLEDSVETMELETAFEDMANIIDRSKQAFGESVFDWVDNLTRLAVGLTSKGVASDAEAVQNDSFEDDISQRNAVIEKQVATIVGIEGYLNKVFAAYKEGDTSELDPEDRNYSPAQVEQIKSMLVRTMRLTELMGNSASRQMNLFRLTGASSLDVVRDRLSKLIIGGDTTDTINDFENNSKKPIDGNTGVQVAQDEAIAAGDVQPPSGKKKADPKAVKSSKSENKLKSRSDVMSALKDKIDKAKALINNINCP